MMSHTTSARFLQGPAPAIVAALHLPDLSVARGLSMAFLEDYALTNARVFAEAGVPAMMLQDQTRQVGPAAPATIAVTAALGRQIRKAFPAIELGIIVQAHDAEAPLAIAHAADASFVRLKVFVAAAMTMEGPKTALAIPARTYRHALRRDDIAILADVYDRTSEPMIAAPVEEAARAAANFGADGLVLTGATFADSLDRVRRTRAAGVRRPLLIGGSVTDGNVADALAVADGAVVSTSLMLDGSHEGNLLRWDADKTRRFMDQVRSLAAKRS